MEIDELKASWKSADFGGKNDNRTTLELLERVRLTKSATALDRLANRYRRFAIISIGIIPLSFSFFDILPDYQLPIVLCYCIFGIVASITDCTLYRGIRSIDVCTMSVAQVATIAYKYKRRHQRFVMFALPCAFCLVGFIMYIVNGNMPVVYGIIFGTLLGLIIGLIQFYRFMSDYKTISDFSSL